MREHQTFNAEFNIRPEHVSSPEYSTLPEYTPVYPDVNFFKESSVTTREENIFTGQTPESEINKDLQEERKKKRSKFQLLQKFLGSAVRGGAAVLAATAVVAAVSTSSELPLGENAEQVATYVKGAQKPAFTQQTGYSPERFQQLWEKDPDGPHKYDYDHPRNYVANSCLEAGQVDLVCLECGVIKHTVLDPHGHKGGEPVKENEAGEVDCTHGASYDSVVYCKVCNAEVSRTRVEIPANGHSAGAPIRENVSATCTEGGTYSEVVYCTVCGQVLSSTSRETAALGHDIITRRENAVDATCTTDGSYDTVQSCTRCGEVISRNTVVLPAFGHSAGEPVEEIITEATCQQEGEAVLVTYCSTCGEEIERGEPYVLAMKDHTRGETVTNVIREATCTAEGETEYITYCSVCGEVIDRSIAIELMYEHNYQIEYEWEGPDELSYVWDEDEVEFVCTATGVCSRCGDVITEEQTAQRQIVQERTCTDDGIYQFVASFDNMAFEPQTKEWSIEARGHTAMDPVEENRVEPSCESVGRYDTVTYCEVCGAEISREITEIPATGHSWGTPEYREGTDPDMNRTMTAVISCLNDSSHGYTETVTAAVATTASCEEGGYTTYQYTFQNELFTTQTQTEQTPAYGHDWEISYEYTVLEANAHICDATATCRRCGATQTETARGVETVNQAIDCEQDGSYTYTYTFQNPLFSVEPQTEEYPAYGHDWTITYTEWFSQDDGNGNWTMTATAHCANNAQHDVEETVICVYDQTLDPTCTEAGAYTYTAEFTNAPFTTQVYDGVIEAIGHSRSEAVEENIVAATCQTGGSWDNVFYCVDCGIELEREHVTTEANPDAHVYDVSYRWEQVESDYYECIATATCSLCGYQLADDYGYTDWYGETSWDEDTAVEATPDQHGSRTYTATFDNDVFTTQTKTAETHYWGWVIEDPTAECGQIGSYYEACYCTVCHEPMEERYLMEEVIIPHDFGFTDEYGKPITPTDDSDLICSRCGAHAIELSIDTDDNGGQAIVVKLNLLDNIQNAGMRIQRVVLVREGDSLNEPVNYYFDNYDGESDAFWVYPSEFEEGSAGSDFPVGEPYVAYVIVEERYKEYYDPDYNGDDPPTFRLKSYNSVNMPDRP